MTGYCFRISARPDSSLAQSAAIALRTKGFSARWTIPLLQQECKEKVSFSAPDGRRWSSSDLGEILALIEELAPSLAATPAPPADWPATLRSLEAQLASLALTQDQREADLAIHHARLLLPDLASPQGKELSGFEVAYAPLLWRVMLFDLSFNTQIAAEIAQTQRQAARLLRHPAVRAVLTRRAARLHISTVIRANAVIAAPTPDWSRALGPEGREPTLTPPAQKWRIAAIGERGFSA